MIITEQDIERAREWFKTNAPVNCSITPLAQYAAHVTAGKNAEIAQLREALEPFALAADKADKNAEEFLSSGMGRMTDRATVGWGVTYGALKKARAVIAAMTGGSDLKSRSKSVLKSQTTLE